MPEKLPDYDQVKNGEIIFSAQISSSSKMLYGFLLLVITTVIVSLPLIKIKITTSASSMIQTALTREKVFTPSTGKILKLSFENNDSVVAGDTLLWVDNSSIIAQLHILKSQQNLLENNLHDLKVIRDVYFKNALPSFRTSTYQLEFGNMLEQGKEISVRYNKIRKDYERQKKIFQEKVISESDFDEYQLKYDQVKNELNINEKRFQAKCSAEEYQYKQDLKNICKQIEQATEQDKKSLVIANISGTIYKTEGVQQGTFLQAGQQLAEVVPDSSLIAFCYVSSKDIGYMYLNQPMHLQVDAFNFIEWGMLTGRVVEISKDITLSPDGKPYFIVKCKLNKDHLVLKNGYKGTLRKGMTCTANFELSERSLWQLIFDKMNDWLNPNISKSGNI